eukprot:m.79130 g.79130  ORF g.79130 m.79130 type:complete len:571 (-) comp8593_c0_seq1:3482-5194(-)
MGLTPEQIKALVESKKREIRQMASGIHTPSPGGIRTPAPFGIRTPLPHGIRTPAPPPGIRTPVPHGIRTPAPHGIMTPIPHGIRTPIHPGIRTPLPHGVATPLPFGVQTPLPGQVSLLHERIQAQLEGLRQRAVSETGRKARNLIMDASGRMVDAEGNVIVMERRAPELSVNMKAKRQQDITKLMQEPTNDEDNESNPFFDERIAPKQKKTRKTFNFVDPGHFQEQANRDRAKHKLERLQAEIASASQKTGLSAVTKIALIAPKKEELEVTSVPDVEWWDKIVLDGGYELLDDGNAQFQEITNLVQHPITIDPPGSERKVAMPVYLTKQEKKKMRRQRRKAIIEEKTEKIRLGLVEPSAPKVKISNLMRVLGTEAVADPTKIEAIAKAQMDLRQQQHTAHNEAQTLTKAERSAKKAKKLQESTPTGVFVAVFRVGSLRDEATKFKVNMNAQQYNLSGCAMMTNDTNVVVVEGGTRGIRRYKALMLRRIKWNKKEEVESDDENENGRREHTVNYCDLVWEGVVERRNFRDFAMKLSRTEQQAREFFDKRNVAHYWDLALTTTALRDDTMTV